MTTWQQLKNMFSPAPANPEAQSFSLTVQKVSQVGAHVRRITLGGSAIRKLPQLRSGSCIRLLFETDGAPLQRAVSSTQTVLERPFTVRFCDRDMLLITIDVMLGGHLPDGPARRWANTVALGEAIQVKGPWLSAPLKDSTDWVLLAGEVAAIPAIAHHLEALHPATRGVVALHNTGMAENILLSKPVNMDIIWSNGRYASLPQLLQHIPRLKGTPAAWVGAMQRDVSPLHQWLEQALGVPQDALVVTPYDNTGQPQVAVAG